MNFGTNFGIPKITVMPTFSFFADFADGELRNIFPLKRKGTKINTADIRY